MFKAYPQAEKQLATKLAVFFDATLFCFSITKTNLFKYDSTVDANAIQKLHIPHNKKTSRLKNVFS